jgi:quercetin dioxygenase-like cupin family protein
MRIRSAELHAVRQSEQAIGGTSEFSAIISSMVYAIFTRPTKLKISAYRAKMKTNRVFKSAEFFQPVEGEPMRSVVTESKDAVVVAWYIQPGQEIAAHIHPHGQDTWTILSGGGEYYLDETGLTQSIVIGDVVVAEAGSVHGVWNNSDEPLVFISVVSPADAGYQLVDLSKAQIKN